MLLYSMFPRISHLKLKGFDRCGILNGKQQLFYLQRIAYAAGCQEPCLIADIHKGNNLTLLGLCIPVYHRDPQHAFFIQTVQYGHIMGCHNQINIAPAGNGTDSIHQLDHTAGVNTIIQFLNFTQYDKRGLPQSILRQPPDFYIDVC